MVVAPPPTISIVSWARAKPAISQQSNARTQEARERERIMKFQSTGDRLAPSGSDVAYARTHKQL
jgi:hypothetical protein